MKDYERENGTKRKEQKKKGGFLGKFVALLLGFVLGVTGVVGGVAGVGWYALTHPVNELEDKVNGIAGTDIDLQKYLTDTYYQGTVKDLLGGVIGAAQAFSAGTGSFSSLNAISPAVGEAISKLADKIVSFGTEMSRDEIYDGLLNTKLSDFGSFLVSVLDTVRVGELLLNTGAFGYETLKNDPLMLLFFYGVEGEDYVLDDEAQKIVAESPLTVGDLRKNGLTVNLQTIPLDSLVSAEGDIMHALLYGSSERYEKNEAGEIVMKPAVYTLEDRGDGEKIYDDKDNAYELTSTDGVLTITVNDKTQYLEVKEGNEFYAFKDAEKTQPVLYTKTSIGDLQNNPNKILNGIELGSAMHIDGNANPILRQLAYGEEGVDYEIVDTEIVLLPGGKKPTTIGDLQEDGKMNETISNISLSAIMTNIDYEDSMILSLLYGAQWRYTTVEENGATVGVQMKQVSYLVKDGKFYDEGGNEIDGELGALDGDKYPFTVDGETFYLKTNDNQIFTAWQYENANEPYLYKKTTIGQLQNDPSAILNDIELGTVLGVTKDSNKILIAISYGKLDIDYRIDSATGKIIPINPPTTIKKLSEDSDSIINGIYIADAVSVTADSHSVLIALAYGNGYTKNADGTITSADGQTPRTISDLSGENSKNLIDEITLEDALGITHESDAVIRALAFGTKGVQYEVNAQNQIVMNQVYYTWNSDAYGKAYIHDHTDEILEITSPASLTASDVESLGANQVLTLTLQSGETLRLVKDSTYHDKLLKVDENGEPVYYQKATIGELSGNSQNLLNEITLQDALGIQSFEEETDAFKKAIAFSKDGKPYTIGQLSEDPSSIVNEIHLDSVMTPNPASAMTMYLLYGKRNIHFTIKTQAQLTTADEKHATQIEDKDEFVVMLQKQMAVHYESGKYHLHNEYGEPVYAKDSTQFVELTPRTTVGGVVTEFEYSIVDENDIVHYYRLKKANDLPDIRIKMTDSLVNDIQTYAPAYYVEAEVKDDYGNAHSGVFETEYYEHNKMRDLTSGETEIVSHLTARLTLEEVLESEEVHSNVFLTHLAHTTIDELPVAIDSLTVTQVFEDQVFETEKDSSGNAVLVNGEKVYFLRETQTKVYKNPENGKYYASYARNGSVYTYAGEVDGMERALTGTWKYLLSDPQTGETKDCAVTDINTLVDNMTENIQGATLGELVEDGIITFQDDGEKTADEKKENFLNAQFMHPTTGEIYKLKEMSIIGMLELIMSMSTQA